MSSSPKSTSEPRSIMSLPRHRRVQSAIALALGSAFALLLAETAVRWIAPQPVWKQPKSLYVADPLARYRLRAGVDGKMTDRTEYAIRIVTDERGARIPAGGPSDPRGAFRILALGDSFTFGVGVEEEETWIEQLGRSLRSQGLSVRTLNGGVPGYGAPDEAALFEHHLAETNPHLVILGVYLANDLLDASPASFSVEVRDGLLVVGGHHATPLDWLNAHSHLFVLAKTALLPARGALGLGPTRTQRQIATEMGAYARELTPGARLGLTATDAAYARLVESTRERGARLVAMVIPEHIAVDREAWRARFAFIGGDPAAYDPEGPRRIFRSLLEKHAIPYLDLTEAVASEEDRGRHLYFPYDTHFTAAGHALAARELERFLRASDSSGLPEIPPPRLAGLDPTPAAARRRPARLAIPGRLRRSRSSVRARHSSCSRSA